MKPDERAMKQLNSWRHTRIGYLVFGLVELGLAYGAVSWAIDSGNLLVYLLTLVLLVGTVRNFVGLAREILTHGKS